MPLPLPNLDNKRQADLLAEARTSIPALHPDWTDHNPSDPGITIVELFAWLAEAVIYRTNQSTDDVRRVLLRLLRGPEWPIPDGADLEQATYETISALRARERAVTGADYEELLLRELGSVARVKCVPERSLDPFLGDTPAPGHVSVVVLPSPTYAGTLEDLVGSARAVLHPKRLLTTRLHVVGPSFLQIPVTATLVAKAGFKPENVAADAAGALLSRFDAFIGGRDGRGWPFGRDVHVSEIHALLDEVPGVDYVEELALSPDPLLQRTILNDAGELVGIRVLPHELVELDVAPGDLTIV